MCIFSVHFNTSSYDEREANQGQATVINEPLGLKDYNLVLL